MAIAVDRRSQSGLFPVQIQIVTAKKESRVEPLRFYSNLSFHHANNRWRWTVVAAHNVSDVGSKSASTTIGPATGAGGDDERRFVVAANGNGD